MNGKLTRRQLLYMCIVGAIMFAIGLLVVFLTGRDQGQTVTWKGIMTNYGGTTDVQEVKYDSSR